MAFSGGIKRVCSGSLILLVLLAPGVANAFQNPHAFMSEPDRCSQCHQSAPEESQNLLTRDVVTLCRQCHSVAHRMSHPVDIRPQWDTPAELPLDSEGTITCATCHDPHAEPLSRRPYVDRGLVDRIRKLFSSSGYRTYFLRISNTKGELCLACHARDEIDRGYLALSTDLERDYTGSRACRRCHEEIFIHWSRTPHARTLSDPMESPGSIAASFSGEEGFEPGEVQIVIGVHWTQRYVVNRGGEQRVARGVWSIGEGAWSRSLWREQVWKDDCAGCHLTGYDPYRDSYVEKGVGCEMCHGPGGEHVRSGKGDRIINPAALEWPRAASICASCHTNGHDRTGQFRYPVGYLPGLELDRFYLGLLPHVGQGPDTFRGDGTLEDRLRSFSYWRQNLLKPSRTLCKQCKSLHATAAPGGETSVARLSLAQYCLSCHHEIHDDPGHGVGSGDGMECTACHAPLEDEFGRPSVHDHKYGGG